MIILLSPTKKQNQFSSSHSGSLPYFINEAETLVSELKKVDLDGIKKLFKVSDNIASLNYNRFQHWDDNTLVYNSIFTFVGEAFNNLDPGTLSKEDLDYLNENLLILSGLYGVLKPYDLIKNYRLDIADNLKVYGSNLYSYWEGKINNYLEERIKSDRDKIILNLASEEYTKKINFDSFNCNIITPKFLIEKNGKLKNIAIWSKKMRGAFVREVAIKRANTVEKINEIELTGFSRDNNFTYIRRDS